MTAWYKNARTLLALVILVLAAALAVMVFRNFPGGSPEEILESLPRNIDLSLKEINYTETRDGVRRWTLVADSAAHDVAKEITLIKNIRMTFYDDGELGDVTLTAADGELKMDTHQVVVRGSVVIKSSAGYAFYTEGLRYREEDRMILTDRPVRFVSDQMELSGQGMRFDVRDRSFQLLSGVQAYLEGRSFGRSK